MRSGPNSAVFDSLEPLPGQPRRGGAVTDVVHRVAVVPGDGIGREVVPAAQRVLERTGRLHGFGFEWDELPWGLRPLPGDRGDDARGTTG